MILFIACWHLCLCLSNSEDCREGQNTGGLPASERNPAEDACCILIRLQSKAGGVHVGGGTTNSSSNKLEIFPKNLN